MIITDYICDLFYRYDCVIVPDFGAFLTERVSAQLSKDNTVFYAPQKRISFNSQVVNNDGLLANYISVKENIPYEKALNKIKLFVQQLHKELNDKGRVSLSEIGFFSINYEQKLVFEPIHTTNYLAEAFGLVTFKAQEITREVLKEQAVAIEEKIPVAFTPQKRKQFSSGFKYAAAVITIFGFGAILLNSYNNKVKNFNTNEIVEAVPLVEHELQSASFVFDAGDLSSISLSVFEPKVTTTVESKIEAKYHIVAGAFREFNNVAKKIKQLKHRGFDAKYIGKNKYGLHQVVYSSHQFKNEAINTLLKIKRTQNPSAWLLVNK